MIELLRDIVIHVSFEQRHAHLAHRVRDVCLADRAMTAKVFENVLKLVA